MSALPPITEVGRRIHVSIWLSVYEYTPSAVRVCTFRQISGVGGSERIAGLHVASTPLCELRQKKRCPFERLRFLRVVSDEADQEREDHAADRAAADVPNPPLHRLSRDRPDELADDAATDRARDRVAQCADRI
jgi:hypothetical protein